MSPRRAKATQGRVGDDPATALRGHLIDTAERLLAEHQVGQITTRQIARAAGVSDGVLYNYFADKNDLLVAALLRRYGQLLGRYDARLPEAGTATVEANLVAYAEAALELVAQALPIAAGLMTEPHLLHRFVADIHREPFGPQRLREPLAAYLAAEQRLGRLADVPLEAAITLILGPVIMLGFTELVGGQPREVVSAQLPAIVRTLLTGLDPS
ncbi:MAG: TetR/AcrR family transcriptional regulator [Hamadaea sp.]|nr:TetR/AcrR family transcriptional regulator [Hamadaea sp.]NUR48324.1 TetR/AcrR family transcriptional regulator [Hamadaea sp.]NUT08582.1 TetR/AcrR family transcriptional regulator [Hamadaea sp.]